MSYLIDSDIVIDFLFARQSVVTLISQLRRSGIALSVITCMEITEGIAGGATSGRARQGFRLFLRKTRVFVVSRAIADQSAAIRLELRRQNRQVNERALDLIVAATAIEHVIDLVTRNIRDYQDIPGLRLHPLT